jgi:speckle-type POZ protein
LCGICILPPPPDHSICSLWRSQKALLRQDTQFNGALAQHLLAAADRYGLDSLKLVCEDKLCGGVDVGTVTTTLALADQLHCSQLNKRCIEFILASLENLDAVMATEGYKHLMATSPLLVNDLLRAAIDMCYH